MEHGWALGTQYVAVPTEYALREQQLNGYLTVRIVSSAMILSTSHPNKSMFIAESALQDVGLSPLLFEVSLVLLVWYETS